MRSIRHLRRVAWPFVLAVIFTHAAGALDRDRSIAQFYYTFWSEKDGAPSQITTLAQSRDGYLWIGSARGLYRFDGVTFAEYRPSGVALPSHSVYSMLATPDGGLWIGFKPDGLGFLKDGRLTVFTKPGERPDAPVVCMVRDLDGRIWAGTEAGLALREGTRWVTIGRDWNFPRAMIRALFVDREGTLWAATVQSLYFLKRGAGRFEFSGSIGSGVTTLGQDKDGRVWLADDGSWQVRHVPTAGRDSSAGGPVVTGQGLHDLLFDRDGALWITRMDSGIVRIRYPEKLQARRYRLGDPAVDSLGPEAGFSAGFAYELFEDREGNIWAGCSNGLVRFRRSQVVPADLRQRYQKMTMLAGKDGGLWVGTIDPKPLLHIRGQSVIPAKIGGQISSVFRDTNGEVWWGTRTGIWRQRGTTFQFFPLPREVAPDWIYDIIPDRREGGLWIKLGDIGLLHFREGVWNLHAWPEGVPSSGGTFRYGPSASYEDTSGRLWLGYTSGQILRLDAGRVTTFSQKDGLDVRRIKVIRGRGQQLWAGGELGLVGFTGGRFFAVTGEDGEPFAAISGIIATSDGGLWLNEMRGIVHISPEEVRRFLEDPGGRVKYRRFDYLDGLPGTAQMEFTNATAVEAEDGRLWFATDNGLAWIDPAHLVTNTLPPPVLIRGVIADGRRYERWTDLKVPARTKNLQIDYTGLSLTIPERVHFRYRLAGLDKGWQDVGMRRAAFYTNLEPGHYQFQVIACNDDGVWNETGALLNFSIAPAYYQTNWFRALCVAALLGLLWMLHQFRVWKLRQSEIKLREVIATIPTFAWTALPDGYVDFLNRHYEDYTGLPVEKAVGSCWPAVVHPEDLQRHVEKFRSSMATGAPFEIESRFRRADGEYRWFLTRAVPLRDSRGKIVKWYGTSIEIEDRKHAEQLQANLAHISRVNTMSELTASLAHEIKQPIGAAVTNAEACLRLLSRNEPDVPDAREAALEMTKDARRAADIIDRIRLLYQKGRAQMELVDISEVVSEMLLMLRNQANRHSVTMRANLAEGPTRVVADRVQLQQVFMNLMLNGIEAMKDNGGELSIRSQLSEDGELLISITDSGVGLPAERVDEIFNAFFTTKPEGTGLGLAITRSILESHGGRIWAAPNSGRGTTFYFTLPGRVAVEA